MLDKFKVKQKIIIGFSAVLVATLFLGIFSIFQQNSLASLTDKLYKHPLTVSNAVLSVNIGIVKIHRSMKDVALAKDEDHMAVATAKVDEYEKEVMKQFDIIQDRFLGDKSMYLEAMEAFKNWRPIRNEVISFMISGEREAAAGITKGKGAKHVALLTSKMDALNDFAQNKAVQFWKNAENERASSIVYVSVMIVIVLGLSLVIAFYLGSIISTPVKDLSEAAQKVTDGDLDVSVNLVTNDELKTLADSFNEMVESIQRGQEDLIAEKESVQKQVEEAVEESEKQKVYLSESVSEIMDSMDKFAAGDLTVQLEAKQNDEIGKLFKGFNNVVKNISDLITHVSSAV